MEFKNAGDTIKVRLDEGKGYKWITVKTGEVVDIPEKVGIAYKFQQIEKEPEGKPKKQSRKSKK
jgi:hypothetical protein